MFALLYFNRYLFSDPARHLSSIHYSPGHSRSQTQINALTSFWLLAFFSTLTLQRFTFFKYNLLSPHTYRTYSLSTHVWSRGNAINCLEPCFTIAAGLCPYSSTHPISPSKHSASTRASVRVRYAWRCNTLVQSPPQRRSKPD